MPSGSVITYLSILRWVGRLAAVLLVGFVLTFLIGEGPPNPFHVGLRQNLQFLAILVAMPAGFLIGLRWELTGAIVAILALGSFYALEYATAGRVPGGAFPVFFVPPALFLAHYLLQRRLMPHHPGG